MSEEQIFETIKDIINDGIGIEKEKITMDSSLLEDLSADSLDLVEMVTAIEDEFDIEISEEKSQHFRTVRDVVEYIKECI